MYIPEDQKTMTITQPEISDGFVIITQKQNQNEYLKEFKTAKRMPTELSKVLGAYT